jgi:hypothetical protein
MNSTSCPTESTILKFSTLDPIKAYAHHTIPLSIGLSDPKYQPWLYEHFIQIFSFVKQNILQIDYTEQLRQYREILDIIQVPFHKSSTVTDLVSFLINSINNNLYVTIYVDEFYLENRYASNKLHYMRQIVVNGFDAEARFFHCKGFTRYNDATFRDSGYDQYAAETIPFDTLIRAYNEGHDHYNDPLDQYIIIWGQKKDSPGYQFNIQSFITRLNQYINSSGQMLSQTAIGQNVFKILEESIYWMIYERRATLDSRAFYVLYEHKQRLHDSLMYIQTLIDPPSEIIQRLTSDYSTLIVAKAQKLFYQYLHFEYKARIKGLIVDQVFSPWAEDTPERRYVVKTLEGIISAIQELKIIDMKISTDLCHELMHWFNGHQ